MAQQINLFSPILLTPRRYFSARAMAQAASALALGLALLGGWSLLETAQLRRQLLAADAAYRAEKQHLETTLARQGGPRDAAALEQELAHERQALAAQQRTLDELSAGALAPGTPPSAWLLLLAETAPPALWLTELRLGGRRVELGGATTQPEVLRPWLERLGSDPLAAGQPFAALKVEQRTTAGRPAWSFVAGSGALAAEEAK